MTACSLFSSFFFFVGLLLDGEGVPGPLLEGEAIVHRGFAESAQETSFIVHQRKGVMTLCRIALGPIY